MDPNSLIYEFHNAARRDLLVYMIALAAAAIGSFAIALALGSRMTWTFAIIFLILAGGLSYAAVQYSATIPELIAADISNYSDDPTVAAKMLPEKYSLREAGGRFATLTGIWLVLIVVAVGVSLIWANSNVRGIAFAVVVVSLISFTLDALIFARDLRYASQWTTGDLGGPSS